MGDVCSKQSGISGRRSRTHSDPLRPYVVAGLSELGDARFRDSGFVMLQELAGKSTRATSPLARP